ncbi:MAG: M56 family metallopeptidase [Oscillospiraceae bacterium]|nr:M56 family metallopeptidase [Oscillospiraceae bacterium]
MLESVFHKLLYMSFSAMWLAVAVLALRVLLRRAPRRVILLLWALVAVRLVCPVSVESRISVVPRPETVAQSVELPAEAAAPAVDFHAERLWLVGASAMLLWGVWGDIRLRRRVRISLPQGDNVRLCDEIDTPFVLGTLRPRIYLPSSLEEEQAGYVLAHEQAHIARGDHWWKPLGWVLLSVYWFHPVLWISYILFCRDLELACDERVAASLDRDGLAAYSEALLKCSVRRGALASPVAFGETGVKTRVRAILRYRKPALRVVLSAMLCVVVVGALFLTDRPAVAMQLAETVLPERKEGREDDWTLPRDGQAEQTADAPDVTPVPAGTPDAAAPADQTVQTYSQDNYDQAALEASLQEQIRKMNEEAAEANRQAAAQNVANGTAPSVSSSSSNMWGITPDYYSNDPPPGPTSALTVSTGSGPAHPTVPNPNPQYGIIQYNDGTIAISLGP